MAENEMEVRIPGLEVEHAEQLRGLKVGSVMVVRTFSMRSEAGSRAEGNDDEGDGESEGDAEGDEEESSEGDDGEEESAPTDRATDGGSERNVGPVSESDGDGDEEDDEESPDEGEVAAANSDGADEEDEPFSDANDSDEDGEDEDESEPDNTPPRTLTNTTICVVLSVVTAKGDDATITDLLVRPLSYQHPGAPPSHDTFRLYGTTIRLHDTTYTPATDESPDSVADALAASSSHEFDFTLHPTGDSLRYLLFGPPYCPGTCSAGWLASQDDLNDLLSASDLPSTNLQPYRPVCPVCVGLDLLNEQVTLCTILSLQGHIDLGLVVEWLGRLNPRRRVLGYGFKQFDEREWGFAFEDMLDDGDSDDDGDGVGGGIGGGGFENWDEAMDPNANPKTRPAAEGTIERLQRCTYGELAAEKGLSILGEREAGAASCAICQDGVFTAASEVVVLSCGHVYDEECLASWIKQYDNCPECRARVSGMVEAEGDRVGEEGEEDAEMSDADEGL